MASLENYKGLEKIWQRLQVGVLFTSHDIRRYVSQCKELQGKEEKMKYLQEWVDTLSEEIKNIYQGYERMTEKDTNILTKKVFLYMADLKKREKLLKGLTMDLQLLKFDGVIKKGGVSPEEIAMARAFPFKELIELKRGFAFCPFHNDRKTPNFSVKNNWGRCFACNWSGDSIKFIMDREKVNFVEAVKRLGR